MKLFLASAILSGALITVITAADPLKVCSFNVQIFGANKAKKGDIMDILGRIFRRYDLCLIQEIRDTSDASIKSLLNKINNVTDNIRMIISDRLGRSNSKEQYAYFYNKNKLTVTDSFHFDDKSWGDLFEREPFIVRFSAPSNKIKDFFIAGIHTNPSKAKQEINDLTKVYDDAVKKFKNVQNGIIMGDFNAGCSYFPKKDWPTNALRNDTRFSWLVGDDADTTIGKTKCAYDRVVVRGDTIPACAKNASTFYYDAEYKVTPDTIRLVSDHYPIEFTID